MANERRMDRRRFLRNAGAAGIGVAMVAPLSSAGAAGARKVTVFRLSTRGVDACSACKGHGANRYFRTRKVANRRRAHKGCNCQILPQKISKQQWNAFFLKKDGSLRNQWDIRWSARGG